MEAQKEDSGNASEPTVTEMANTSMTVPWSEGTLEDFSDLHSAIEAGQTQKFSGTDTDSCPDDDEEEDDVVEEEPSPDDHGPRFLWAAQHGLLEELKRLYEVKKDLLNYKDGDGYTALHRASYSNQPEVVLFLLKNGADIHSTTEDDWNPLHSACRWNAYPCVEILLAWGANVNAVTHGGQSPLHLAAFCKKARETIQLLLMHPHIKESVQNCQQDTPKDIAMRNGNCPELFDLVQSHFRDF